MPLASPALNILCSSSLTDLQLYETLKTCFVSWSAKCFSFFLKWFLWISAERTIWGAFLSMCERLLVNLWNYVKNWEMPKLHLETMKYDQTTYLAPSSMYWIESGKHRYWSLIIRTSQYQHSSLMGEQVEWVVCGSLVWRDPDRSCFCLSYMNESGYSCKSMFQFLWLLSIKEKRSNMVLYLIKMLD